jgi:hypothetical protein
MEFCFLAICSAVLTLAHDEPIQEEDWCLIHVDDEALVLVPCLSRVVLGVMEKKTGV